MFDRLTGHRRPSIHRPAHAATRSAEQIATAFLLTGALSSPTRARGRTAASSTYPLSSQDVPAADYPKIRAQFAGARWPDLRSAGTAYVDLAIALRTARGTDGYETVWFYQRLSAACAKHGRALDDDST